MLTSVGLLLLLQVPRVERSVDSTWVSAARRGQAILAGAVEAAGGAAALNALTSVDFLLEGDSYNPLQGASPKHVDAPQRDGLFRSRTVADLRANLIFQETETQLAGGLFGHNGAIFTPTAQFNINYAYKQYSPGQVGPLLDAAARYFPPLALRQIIRSTNAARWRTKTVIGAQTLDVLEVSYDASTRYLLSVDSATRAIVRLDMVQNDPLAGLIESSYRFTGSRRIANVAVPERVHVVRRGLLALDLALSNVQLNGTIDPSTFRPPAGFSERAVVAGGLVTKDLGAGLFEISNLGGGIYRTFVARGDSGLTIFDAPLGTPAVQQVLVEIKRSIGDLPIRQVVVSHFHSDHAGGVAPYLQLGAKVLVPAGSEGVIARYATAANPLLANSRQLIVAVPDGQRVVLDQKRGLVARSFGRVPHVEGMLIMQDSLSRVVVAADLFSEVTPFNETFAWFADWLAKNDKHSTLFAGTHHEAMTLADFADKRRRFRESDGK